MYNKTHDIKVPLKMKNNQNKFQTQVFYHHTICSPFVSGSLVHVQMFGSRLDSLLAFRELHGGSHREVDDLSSVRCQEIVLTTCTDSADVQVLAFQNIRKGLAPRVYSS